MRSVSLVLAAGALGYGLSGQASGEPQKKPVPPASFERDVQPFLKEHCLPCHSGANPRAGLALDKYKTAASVTQAAQIWERVASNVSSMHMPPKGMPVPPKAKRDAFLAWVQSTLAGDCGDRNPGRVTMRRLNRAEYDNTVRDLTGLDLHLGEGFPSDDVGYGFDNIGDVLTISPLLMEKYLNAAEIAARKTVIVPVSTKRKVEGGELRHPSGVSQTERGRMLASGGQAVVDHDFAGEGRYTLRISASGQQAGNELVKLGVVLDGKVVREVVVDAPESRPKVYTVDLEVTGGKHQIGVEFLNDYYRPGPPPEDRNMLVQWMELESPALPYENLPATHKAIVVAKPTKENEDEIAKKGLGAFATRAFRRPVSPAELERLTGIVKMVQKDGQSFERGMQLAVQAVLSSPHFLFRVESERADGKLNDYEIASRLSYFLWSSMPDARLMSLAAQKKLSQPKVLAAEAKRMLADRRADALGSNFAAQWLNLRKLNTAQPDPKIYPGFNEPLRAAMMEETMRFFNGVVAEDRSVLDFLGAKYSYVNEDLAKHYGIEGVQGKEFRRVSLVGTNRAGLLTQGSILTLTSNPTRTSPVKRGKWVLDQILNQPPPPPPPNVPDLKEKGELTGATLRKKMEQHREDPVCASCHQRMDPIGFSLENFDGTGKWRTEDAGVKIDNSGELPGGVKFAGADELRSLLMAQKGEFVHCLSEKLLTFAIGRGVELSDKCYVDAIAASVAKSGYRFSSVVTAVVESEPFRMRKPSGAVKPAPAKKASPIKKSAPVKSNSKTATKGKKT